MKEMGICYSQTYSYSPITNDESDILEPPPSAFDYQPEPEIGEKEEEEPELVDDTYDIVENIEITPHSSHQESKIWLTFGFLRRRKN